MNAHDLTRRKLVLLATLDRLWGDDRFLDGRQCGLELRELISIHLWSLHKAPDRKSAWDLTLDRMGGPQPARRLARLIREDAPRFEPWERGGLNGRGCEVPKTRGPNAGDPCGRSYLTAFRVTDPTTGEWRLGKFCSQHQAAAKEARAAEAALVCVPEPLPNTGGLLPVYLPVHSWPDLYVKYRTGWTPPYVGIVADQWPVLAQTQEPPIQHAGLRVIDGAGEDTAAARPNLRLIATH